MNGAVPGQSRARNPMFVHTLNGSGVGLVRALPDCGSGKNWTKPAEGGGELHRSAAPLSGRQNPASHQRARWPKTRFLWVNTALNFVKSPFTA